ncbi:putative bifunctional diguanylate cyclase/phosphodiesterase [Blastochloris tepida]|uniref:GGDEF-domain containing protein n=1 Tax=Blastochloris tepida TaxID=2233851 RepID=A0A348FWK7_9HYPH|nr:bifunctional diguanylate cyclase/phosphodiesterase [Blastochloris tepida]BBF91690.1 hypothetical protein BLTE_03750 [Blastochloris tepida]
MTFRQIGVHFCLGLSAALLLLAGAALTLVDVTVERLIRDDAEIAAAGWVNHFAIQIDDIGQIAAGATPSPQSASFLAKQRGGTRVFRFEVYGRDGHLALVSDQVETKWLPAADSVDGRVAEVVANGRPITTLRHSDHPLLPPVYAESYQPVVVGAHVAAVVKAFIDQTQKRARFDHLLSTLGIVFAGLTALAFGASAIALRLRAQQKQASDQTAEHLAIERKVAQVRAEFLAQRDELTGLLNRATLLDRLSKRLGRLPETGLGLAVHNIDLGHLKTVNDTHGYDIGDGLIRAVAETLSEAIGEVDLIGRISGNGFLVVQDEVESPADAIRFAARLKDSLDRPFVVKGLDLASGAAIGVAIAPGHGATAEALLHSSELALDAAQSPGVRNHVCRFELGMEDEIRHRRELEALVENAAANDAFELHFQPVVSARDGAPVYFEALLRLPRPGGGYVPPSIFVPIAEDLGLINGIGAWALNRACRAAAGWPDALGVAVNLSPLQFSGADLNQVVAQALAASGLAPRRLELEITEGLLLKHTESVLHQLQGLREIGVSIAMDDFGTGYSSLGYLWRFPFDKIKIDRSFIVGWQANDRHVAHILRTIVSLGRTLNMLVTAEGIEHAAQAALLRDLGCDFLQGFHFSRPLPEAEVAPYLLQPHTVLADPRRTPALQLVTG